MTPGIFIDRDGTLIKEVNFLHKPEQVVLTDGMIEAVRFANEKKIPVIVVSNQSGVGRGLFTETDVVKVHQYIEDLFKEQNATISGFYFCPHWEKSTNKIYSTPCKCRKPGSELFQLASKKHKIDLNKSVMIGDKMLDLQAGWNLKMKSVLVETGYGHQTFIENELPKNLIVSASASNAIIGFLNDLD